MNTKWPNFDKIKWNMPDPDPTTDDDEPTDDPDT